MPSPKKSDNPNALSAPVTGMVTETELHQINRLAAALGMSRSAAVRFLIRAAFETDKVKSLMGDTTSN
jgi:hypothetical protein